MRLLIADADLDEVKASMAGVDFPGTTVQVNPLYLDLPIDDPIMIACGAPALKMLQSGGFIPNKGGVVSNRGKLFKYQKDGWLKPMHFGVSYAPTIRSVDYGNFIDFQCDLSQYYRFQTTGSIEPKLGLYKYVRSAKGVIDYICKLFGFTGAPVELCIDLETMGLYPWYEDKHILSVSFTAKPGISDVIYIPDLTPDELQTLITDLHWIANSTKIKVVGANFKFDMLWLRVKWGISFSNFAMDTCNGGSLLEENRSNTLNVHTKVYVPDLGGYDDHFNRTVDKSKMETVPKPILLPYAGGDTDAGLQVYHHVREGILADNLTASGKPAKNSLASLYMNVVHPALKAVHKMEYHGVRVDVEKFHEYGADLRGRMVETAKKAIEHLPKTLIDKYGGLTDDGGAPLSKPNMIAEYLFQPSGLNLDPLETTAKTGAPSTSQYHLEQFKDHPVAGPLVQLYADYKAVAKMHGTYYEGFLKHLRPDNRWHASYIIHRQGDDKHNEQGASGTVTGRGSAVDPAFQCVTGDSLILTGTGVRQIKDVVEAHDVSEKAPCVPASFPIWTPVGWRKTSFVFRSWRHDLLKVRLNCGVELKCTPEHPLMTTKGWMRAKDIGPGVALTVPDITPRLAAPPGATPGAAYAAAAILATATYTEAGGYVYLQVHKKELAALQEALGYVDAVFEVDNLYGKPMIRFPHEAEWTDELHWLYEVTVPHTETPTIPPILRCNELTAYFIRGLYETVGHFSSKGEYSCALRPRRPSEELIRLLQIETLHFGCVPGTRTKQGLFHQGRAFWALARAVGLYLPPEQLAQLPNEKGWYGPPSWLMTVASVEDTEDGYVYDVTVPGPHAFTANGLIVHNTVPKHSYWGKRLRECIIAPEGKRMVGIDYSQGELKITACWAGEPTMIAAYKNGVDLHTLTAATVNGMSYEEAINLKTVNKDAYDQLRQNGKAGNFGLIYGMNAFGFMMYAAQVYGVNLTLEEAEAMRDGFFDLYPLLPMWHQRQISEAVVHGFVRSPLGRTRRLYNILSPHKKTRKHAENQAINSPIQGTLGDMMWWSMGIVEHNWGDVIHPCGNVHDQGLWYVDEDHWERDTKRIVDVMENLPFEEKFGWKPELAFTVDAEVGSSLASLEKVAFA